MRSAADSRARHMHECHPDRLAQPEHSSDASRARAHNPPTTQPASAQFPFLEAAYRYPHHSACDWPESTEKDHETIMNIWKHRKAQNTHICQPDFDILLVIVVSRILDELSRACLKEWHHILLNIRPGEGFHSPIDVSARCKLLHKNMFQKGTKTSGAEHYSIHGAKGSSPT